ncbi:tripartite motif-containing protein 2-like isoform X2 [Gigantopelta aegis]|nr:tripartite motif-containing protein 2-like isoform X2 [Gigantopelta aegis]
MATSADFNDDISCTICLNIFVSPRSLPCGHTFCHNCLNEHINKTVTRSTFSCPICRYSARLVRRNDDQDKTESLAEQFPINYALVQTVDAMQKLQTQYIKAQLKTDRENLERSYLLAGRKTDSQCEQQLQQLDVNVIQISENIDKTAYETIEQLTSAIRSHQKILHQQLVNCHKTAQTKILERSRRTKALLTGQKASVDLLLNASTVSESEIQNEREKVELLHKTSTDFRTSHDEVSPYKITFTKSNNVTNISTHFGTLKLTEEHTASSMNASSESRQALRQIDREKDSLQLVTTIMANHSSDTFDPILTAIDVLLAGGSLKILVADNNNHCVKSFNHDGTLHCLYKPNGIPNGLVKFRDNEVVVTLTQQKEIVFLKVNDKDITLTKRVTTEKSFTMITVLPNFNLAAVEDVSDGMLYDIMDQDCRVIWCAHDILPNEYLEYLTVIYDCLLIGSMGCHETAGGVKCVTTSGDIKWATSNETGLMRGGGITCDANGFIYVANPERDSVVQLTSSGQFVSNIITQDHVSYPKPICFYHDQLYVGQRKGEIKVFTWKTK